MSDSMWRMSVPRTTPGPRPRPRPVASSDRASGWWVIPIVATALIVPVWFFLLLVTMGTASQCDVSERTGPCPDVDLQLDLAWKGNLLSIPVGLLTWVWPHTRRGTVLRRWNPAAYATLVIGVFALVLITSRSLR